MTLSLFDNMILFMIDLLQNSSHLEIWGGNVILYYRKYSEIIMTLKHKPISLPISFYCPFPKLENTATKINADMVYEATIKVIIPAVSVHLTNIKILKSHTKLSTMISVAHILQ